MKFIIKHQPSASPTRSLLSREIRNKIERDSSSEIAKVPRRHRGKWKAKWSPKADRNLQKRGWQKDTDQTPTDPETPADPGSARRDPKDGHQARRSFQEIIFTIMEITDLLKYLQDYGVSVTIISDRVVLRRAFGQTGLKHLQENSKPAVFHRSASHAFFSTVDQLVNYHIPRCESRPTLCATRAFGTCWPKTHHLAQSDAWSRGVGIFPAQNVWDQRAVFGHASRLRGELRAAWKAAGVPELVISKFAQWHSPRLGPSAVLLPACLTASLSRLRRNAQCRFVPPKRSARETIIDAERTLGELNGELSGLIIKV